ncbi:MAG: hypothetical protein Kow00121_09760 [Elainellaceae cyanobacterium]
MQQWEWSKANEKDLAKFVNGDAVKLFDKLGVNRFDLSHDPEGRKQLVEAIYKALVDRNIDYAYEKYQPDQQTQILRSPHEILGTPREGTCLDLAVLFCSLCLGYELLPLLIVIEGHALAAVSLNHGLSQWEDSFNRERNLFKTPQLFTGQENLEALRQLMNEEAYIAVECTGFAHTQSFANSSQPEAKRRKADGTLSFGNALSAGRDQLDNASRPFQFAIDIAVAHYFWKIAPLPLLDFDGSEIQPDLSATPNIHIEASGDRAVAVQNAQGANIVTGDSNVVGNNNVVQKVTQGGTYSINLGISKDLHIGDTIHRDKKHDRK